MDEKDWRNHPHWGEVTTRAYNVISNATGSYYGDPPTWTIEQLCDFTADDILRWPGAGRKVVAEIEGLVAAHGKQLKASAPQRTRPAHRVDKPNEISADVMDAANEVSSNWKMPGGEDHAALTLEIAQAMTAIIRNRT